MTLASINLAAEFGVAVADDPSILAVIFGFVEFSFKKPGVAMLPGMYKCTLTFKGLSSERIQSANPRMAYLLNYDLITLQSNLKIQ